MTVPRLTYSILVLYIYPYRQGAAEGVPYYCRMHLYGDKYRLDARVPVTSKLERSKSASRLILVPGTNMGVTSRITLAPGSSLKPVNYERPLRSKVIASG